MAKKKNRKKKKKRIQTRVRIHNSDNTKKDYIGRSLGFIRPEEYALLLDDKKLRRKLYTFETKPLENLLESSNNVDGLRYVLAVQSINGKETAKKKLVVSEPLDYVHYSDETGAYMTGKSGNIIEVEELT